MSRGVPIIISGSKETSWGFDAPDPVSLKQGTDAPFDEALLQEMIDRSESVLPINDFLPGKSIVSLGREVPVVLADKSGYIDNLLVASDGHLILVETKLWRNPGSAREVIAQVLEYGMALSGLSLPEVERQSRKGIPKSQRLAEGETILTRLQRTLRDEAESDDLDRFEERFEQYLRRGELVYLIVSDGVRHSVERLSSWLNDLAGSSPFRFGVVEFRFFQTNDGRTLAIPRTLLRTREISRHVVIVDIKGHRPENVDATVHDELRTPEGARAIRSRAVLPEPPSVTREHLLEIVAGSGGEIAKKAAHALSEALESRGLDSRGLKTTLQYGLQSPEGDGDFFPFISLQATGAWAQPPAKIVKMIPVETYLRLRRALNAVGPFYGADQVEDLSKASYLNAKTCPYAVMEGKVEQIADAISEFREAVADTLASR